MKSALIEAINAVGTQTALANRMTELGTERVQQQNIWWWLNKADGRVPGEHVLTMEAASGVSRYRLRPDIFAAEPEVSGRHEQSEAA